MWEDILNNPKQGKSYSLFRSELINLPLEYGDAFEMENTNINMLGEDQPTTQRQENSSEISKILINEIMV